MNIKEIRQLTNLSQKKFCEKYGIPLQTLCKWEQGYRTCPGYVAELLEFKVREDLKMDNSIYDNVFCVDCNGWRRQKLAGKNIYDGMLRYICTECGCENNAEDDSDSQIEK